MTFAHYFEDPNVLSIRKFRDATLSVHEQRHILKDPDAISSLMTYHDIQQSQADMTDLKTTGNQNRYAELKKLGASIIAQDPDIWHEETKRNFEPAS